MTQVLFVIKWIVPFSLIYVTAYTALLLVLNRFWRKTFSSTSGTPDIRSIALLIPFRNEQNTLPRLIKELAVIVPNHWEVILIDDNSEDMSSKWAEKLIQSKGLASFKLVRSDGIGKKAALTKGISIARAEVIITTDADVQLLGRNPWLSLLICFADEEVQMVAGPVFPLEGNKYFEEFQRYEWASVLLVTGASFAMHHPLMCSGANLAFKKSAFVQVGGYLGNEHLLSGDDEFFLKKIMKQFGKQSVRFANSPHAAVFFSPFSKLNELIQQRARWASKWNAHGKGVHYFSAIIFFFVSIFPLATIGLVLAGKQGWLIFILFWTLKLFADYLVLGSIIIKYKQKTSFLGLMLTGALHPVYVIGVGLRIMRGGLRWKGREIK